MSDKETFSSGGKSILTVVVMLLLLVGPLAFGIVQFLAWWRVAFGECGQ